MTAFKATGRGRASLLAAALVVLLGSGLVSGQAFGIVSSASAKATASDLQQECVAAGLKVDVLKSEVFRPGDPKSQSLISRAELKPTSAACQALVKRQVPQVIFQIQNPSNHKVWFSAGKPQGLKGPDGPIGDEGGFGEAYIAPVFAVKDRRLLYRCTPGKGITHVRVIYRTQVDSLDGQKLGQKTYTLPVRIRPVLGPLPREGAVRRAC